MISKEAAIVLIQKAFRGTLPNGALEYVEKNGLLQDIQLSHKTPQEVANLLAPYWPPRKLPPTQETNYGYSISGILAQKAHQEPGVKTFREKHLPDGLLEAQDVGPWIENIAKTERPFGLENVTAIENPVLEYESTDHPVPMGRAISTDGALFELLGLCEWLSFAYRWQPAQACKFVLTGSTPLQPAIQTEGEMNTHLPFISTINLKIHPAMSEKEVAKAYANARFEFFESEVRSRRLSTKHQLLGLFYAQEIVYSENPEPRTTLLEKWNTLCETQTLWEDRWKYGAVTNFQKDAKKAYRELVKDRRKERG